MKLDKFWQSFFWFWLGLTVVALIKAHLRSVTVVDDLTRNQVNFQSWEPYVWEYSSTVVLLMLVFAVAYAIRKFPLFDANWHQSLAFHVFGSVVFSLAHVCLMVMIRKAIYGMMGTQYDFGDWSSEWWYEYRKDVVTYFTLLLWLELYHYLRKHFQKTKPLDGEKLKIKTPNGTVWLNADEIYTVESGGNYVYINSDDQVLLHRKTMAQMQQQLNQAKFIRVHRSYIVNVKVVKAVKNPSSDPFVLVLNNGKEVPVSRKYRHDVQQKMAI
ncbi:MAG: LytR/AlgR family response regulator transcription factor [Marinicella sp.]